jgi:hypothetical protein
MPKLVDEIIDCYTELTGKEPKMAKTPGTPGLILPKNDGQKIDHQAYMKIVGKIQYLVTKLMVEGANPARELAKHFSNPGEIHWKEVERFVGFLKANKDDIRLTLRKPRELRSVINVDSNYAQDAVDRRSVSGMIATIGGQITNHQSKTQPIVTLSSTEAEYLSLSSGAQELLFTQSLLDEMQHCVRPGIIKEDNMGAIFLVNNLTVGPRTKHIDVRHHFIRQHKENNDLTVRFTKGDDNESDALTKNVTEKLHVKFSTNIREGRMQSWSEWEDTVSYAETWKDVMSSPRSLISEVPAVIPITQDVHPRRVSWSTPLTHYSLRLTDSTTNQSSDNNGQRIQTQANWECFRSTTMMQPKRGR